MAQHLDHLAQNFPGKDLEGAEAALEAEKVSMRLVGHFEELQHKVATTREAEEEKAELRRRLCEAFRKCLKSMLKEEELTSQELRRQLEALERPVELSGASLFIMLIIHFSSSFPCF